MNLDAVVAFAVFAEHLNFSAAARALHISQPALHVKIRKLSERLQRPLYQRVGSALILTRHGEQVARFGREIQDQSAALAEGLRQDQSGQRIALAAGHGAFLYLLGPAIEQFLCSPIGQLQLHTADRLQSIELVLSGHAQLGVAPLEDIPEGLSAMPLTDVGQMLVVPGSHRLARRRQIKLSDLQGAPLVVPPQGRPHRMLLGRMLQSAGVSWSTAVETDGWELMIHFVQIGVGISVVNACCRLPAGLVGVPIPALPRLRYQLFHREGARMNPGTRALAELLQANANHWRVR